MKIRFTFSLEIKRDAPSPTPETETPQSPEPPIIFEHQGSCTELAGYQPIGFTIQPTQPPLEDF